MDTKIALAVWTCIIVFCSLAEASSNPALQYIRPVGPFHRPTLPNYHDGYFGNDGHFRYPGYGYPPFVQSFPGYGLPNSGNNGYGGFQNGFGYPGGYASEYGNGFGYYPPQAGYNKRGK